MQFYCSNWYKSDYPTPYTDKESKATMLSKMILFTNCRGCWSSGDTSGIWGWAIWVWACVDMMLLYKNREHYVIILM